MTEGFIRKPTGIEAFFIDLDAGGCNMTFHFYLKLDKKPDPERLKAAMKQILSTHQGINMKFYKDAWYASSYSHECPIVEINDSDLSSYTPCRLDYHQNTVDLKILHANVSDTWYLCFDFFHGVADGRSGMQFIYAFFDVLNNREVLEPEFKLDPCELINTDAKKTEKHCHGSTFTVIPQCAPAHWNAIKKGEDKTMILSHDGSLKGISAHHSAIVSGLFGKKSSKMIIPVDIRRHADTQDKAMYGNLFVPMFLETSALSASSEIHNEIIKFVKEKSLLMKIAKKLNIYCIFPTKLRQTVIRGAIPLVMGSKKFIYCALVSALGTVDSTRLTCEDFAVNDYAATFVSFPFTAFTVISVQFDGHTNTTVSWHSGRVPLSTVDTLVCKLDECMNAQAVCA